jgi:long-chain acyl-CoA synthetase
MTLVPNPRDIGKFVEVLKKRPFHMLPAVNTLFNALLQHPQFRSIDFSQLCVSQAGGMAASEGTARQWRQADRLRDGRRLGHERDLRDRHQQPADATEFSGNHRAAAARHRHRDQGRRRHDRCRSASRARSASAGPT